MADRWLSLAEAAVRVHRTKRTIYRWIDDGELRAFDGRVRESHVLDVDKAMRTRVGRPAGRRVPLIADGREVGHITIRPDGEITGRLKSFPVTRP